jgi:hypothetical protein
VLRLRRGRFRECADRLFVYRQVAAPASVACDDTELPGRTAAELDAGAAGWAYDPALQQVRIQVAEDAGGKTFTIAAR